MKALPLVLAPLLLLGARAHAQADPRFAELRRPMPTSPWTRALALGDWDGDGDVDALVSSSPAYVFSAELWLLANDGSGRLELAHAFYVTPVTAAALGDLDGDGDLDAFLGTEYSPPMTLLNDGAGGGMLATLATSRADLAHDVVLADVQGDRALDALLATHGGVQVFLGQGDGSFAFAPQIYAQSTSPRELAVADFDGDDDVDAVATGTGRAFLFNDGAGSFSVVTEPSQYAASALQLGDVDGDGDPDLVYVDSQLRLRLNDGDGAFVEAPDALPDGVPFSGFVLLRDFDGDADPDLALGSAFLRNDGSGVFSADPTVAPLPPLPLAWFAETADLDQDDDLDLVVTGPDLVLLGDGTGAFFDPIADQRPGSFYGPLALGDVDGDGDPDAVVAAQGWELLVNDGRGVFALDDDALPVQLSSGRPTLADVDGDGDLDLFAPGLNGLALNDGDGQFTLASGCTPGANQYLLDGALADFDGDGDLDAFLGRAVPRGPSYEGGGYNPAPDALWRNDGGCFVDVTAGRLPAVAGTAFGVAAGDLDGDGDMDAVTSSGQLYRNDGTGTFEMIAIAGEVQGTDVALGDLDGDGDLDVYVASRLWDSILWNDGTGSFPEPPAPGAGAGRNVALADLDDDGDLDVVLGVLRPTGGFGSFVTYTELYVNDGSGAFGQAAYPPTGEYELAVADLDGDQDLDVLHPRTAFMNLTRSLARTSVPRPGRTVDLELHGRPGAYWKLFATTDLLVEPFHAPLGTLWLDPRAELLRRHGRFGASGEATVRVLAPANPALVGTSVYWQALIGAPPRWSAFEETTFTAF